MKTRRCETGNGVPVDPQQLVAATITGRLRSIIVDGAGVIVHAGRLRRLFSGPIRAAIQTLNPVCGWLGCTIRSQLADIDHLQPASRGGPTNPANATPMCRHHNLHKHVAGHHVERDADGTITITRPDNTKLKPPDAAA